MPINQVSPVDMGYVDKRRSLRAGADHNTRTTKGTPLFTSNAGGTTTTLVGVNSAPGAADTNTIKRNEKFRLFNAAGALKEETVFRVGSGVGAIVVGASTTITFAPAAAVATAAGDVARAVDDTNYQDDSNMDTRLLALGYTASQIACMTQNDKVYAIRVADDPGGV